MTISVGLVDSCHANGFTFLIISARSFEKYKVIKLALKIVGLVAYLVSHTTLMHEVIIVLSDNRLQVP